MERYKYQLPAGKLINSQLKEAGDDFEVNDCVTLVDDVAMPMHKEGQSLYGIAAANSIKGQKVLIAVGEKR